MARERVLAKSLDVRIHTVGSGSKLPSLTLSRTERQLSRFFLRSRSSPLGPLAEMISAMRL